MENVGTLQNLEINRFVESRLANNLLGSIEGKEEKYF